MMSDVNPEPTRPFAMTRDAAPHEFFYLLDGEIQFQIGDSVVQGTTGMLMSIPPGFALSFAVASETARVLNMYTPGGFEEQLMLTAEPATALTLPPRPGAGRRTEKSVSEFAGRS